MTQRNGIRWTSDRCSLSEDCVQEKTPGPDDYETENGRPGGEGAVTAPDGGWGWVVLVATVIVLALTLGFSACVGIFYTDLQEDFQATNSETSWVPSIMISALHVGGPFCSVLVERLGCRATVMLGGVLSGFGMAASSFTQSIGQLYITAGVITGLGFCFSFQPAVTILGHYFVRRRAFANAMSSSGTALGMCTLPFLGNYLHTELGWRGSFLVLGAVLLNCCVCGAVMRPLQPPKHRGQPLINHSQSMPDKENVTDRKGWMKMIRRSLLDFISKHMAFDQLCNNSRYCVYTIGISWMMLGFVVPLVYLVPYATANGMDPSLAARLLSIMGVVNISVRPPIGLLFNMPWFKGKHVYVFASGLMVNGLSNSICCFGASFGVLITYVVFYGLSMSVVGSLMFTVLMDIVEMSRFPSALGLLAVMEGIMLLIGPPLAGALVDRTGQYYHVFSACSAVVASAAVFLIVSFCWLDTKVKKSKRGQPSTVQEPGRTVDIVPGCQYSNLPAERDKDKASANGAEHVSSI
ncbi:monocarboxylate transporter 6 [Antennarius striatus]|uniref:monocarboxylate transporter 6 n=1 Tax=Antennarius striatus TaxID=241820 RepID=UPI0035B14AB3